MRTDDWFQTRTGKVFRPWSIEDGMVCIQDVAAALSKICRFGGHCSRFYSVAEHSILLHDHVLAQTGSRESAKVALLHDAAEAYLYDIPRPIKARLPDYRALEAEIESAVAARFGLEELLPAWMKEYDNRMLHSEMLALMPNRPMAWACETLEPLPITIDDRSHGSPGDWELMFLERFKHTQGG